MMKFRNCKSCNKYKYIESDGKCSSCAEDWAVIRNVPHMTSGEVVREGLSKKQAKEITDGDPHMKSVREKYI